MLKIKTKDHLVYFMQSGMMKLSSYDLKFLQNLNYSILQTKPLTSNQVLLFDKLIDKYKRQLGKHKYPLAYLQSLPWNISIVESTSEYTESYIEIIEGKIYVRCPFNKKFLNELRRVEHNPFKWDAINRRYHGNFGTRAFKIIVDLLPRFYDKVNYCNTSIDLLNKISQFSTSHIWEPTLVKINGMCLIAATNQFIDEQLQNVELNTDMQTAKYLSELCVDISNELKQDEKLNFANSLFYETQIENIETVFEWLKELGCDCIFFTGLHGVKKRDFIHKLDELKIAHYNQSDFVFSMNSQVTDSYNYIVNINLNAVTPNHFAYVMNKAKKIIKVHNTISIDIK